MRHSGVLGVSLILSIVVFPGWADNEICVVSTVDDTVENGVGAEAGVVRDFVQDVDVPHECQSQGGNAWILAHELRVTRTNPSSLSVPAMVSVMELGQTRDVEPRQVLIEARFVEVPTDLFPNFGVEWTQFDGLSRAAQVLDLGPAVSFDGDVNANQFAIVDQSAATPVRSCWTRGAALDWLPCTDGNPAIRGVGLGLRVSPTLADFDDLHPGARIYTDMPSSAGTINVDFSGDVPALDLISELRVVDPTNPIPLCTTPGNLPFQCFLTVEERAKLSRSELIILIEPTILGQVRGDVTLLEAQLISADHYIFSNGFESGDGSFW